MKDILVIYSVAKSNKHMKFLQQSSFPSFIYLSKYTSSVILCCSWDVKFCSSMSLFPLSTAFPSSPSTALTKNMYGLNSRPWRPHICYISVCYLCYYSFTDSLLPVLLLFYCFFHLCLRVREQYLAALILYGLLLSGVEAAPCPSSEMLIHLYR